MFYWIHKKQIYIILSIKSYKSLKKFQKKKKILLECKENIHNINKPTDDKRRRKIECAVER